MRFGERLKKLRQEKSVTQAELAKRIGVSPAAISRYESGERTRLSQPTIFAIANALHITWQELVYDTEIEGVTSFMMENGLQRTYVAGDSFLNGAPVTEMMSDEDCRNELLHAFDKLNSAGKTEAVKRLLELGELSKYRIQ